MRAASNELVEVYKILSKAQGPLTAQQIAEQMPNAFKSSAMRKYKEHREGRGKKEDLLFLEATRDRERWGELATAEAMSWYVRSILHSARSRQIVESSGDAYKPGRPPMVKRMVQVVQEVLVPWSQGDETELNSSHLAGVEFLNRLPENLARNRPTQAEWKETLRLAERAIRKTTQG